MKDKLYIILYIAVTIVFTGCGERKRMRILLSDIQYRNSNAMALPTEDSLQTLVDYFNSCGSANEQMQALYVMGCMHKDKGDAPTALKWYHDAVLAADTTAGNCDFKTLSRVYGQMGSIFADMRSPQLEIDMYRKAYEMAYKAQDSINAYVFYLHICDGYFLLGKEDSVLYYSNRAAQKLMEYGAKSAAASALSANYLVYLRKKKYKEAKMALDGYEKSTGYFDDKYGIMPEHTEYYISKADYYNGVGKYDSALYYYGKYLSMRRDIAGMEDAYRGMMSVYRKQNLTDSVAKYCILFAEANDSTNILKSSEEITRLQLVYNYNNIMRKNQEKMSEANERQLWLYIVILAGVILLFVLYLLYQKHQRVVQRRIQELTKRYRRDLAFYLQLKREKDTLQNDHTALESTMNELSRKLAEYEYEKNANLVNNDKGVKNSTIVKTLREVSLKDKVASKQQWIDLNCEMCEHLPLFVWKLNESSQPLTTQEQRVCYLARMEFTAQEIAPLMAVSRQRIINIFTVINSKLFGINSAKNFLQMIQSL